MAAEVIVQPRRIFRIEGRMSSHGGGAVDATETVWEALSDEGLIADKVEVVARPAQDVCVVVARNVRPRRSTHV